MGPLTTLRQGEVVLVRFPFSDLSQTKLRPAVMLADAGRGDWVLCQITSNPYTETHQAVLLTDASFTIGSLRLTSYARPNRLFTAHLSLIEAHLGTLKADIFGQIVEVVINILRASLTS